MLAPQETRTFLITSAIAPGLIVRARSATESNSVTAEKLCRSE